MHVAHAERRANASINRLIQMRSHQALDNAGWTVKSSTFLCGFLFFYDQCRLHSESENQNTEWNLHQRAEYSRHMRVVCSIALQLRLHFN